MRFKQTILLLAVWATGTVSFVAVAAAQSYPTRAITLISPWPAGGAIDALCRELAPKLADRLGQAVIVENRPGAGSTLGVAEGARAVADGYPW